MATPEKFLKERGALDLLFQLSKNPKGFNELKTGINISPNTLLARIKDATSLGLIEEALVRTNKRSLIKYKLTEKGKKTINELDNIKKKYTEIKNELDNIKKLKDEKEKELGDILSSKIRNNVFISHVKGERDVNIDINSESSTKQDKR